LASGCAIFPKGSYWPAYRTHLSDEAVARHAEEAEVARVLPTADEATRRLAVRQAAISRRWADDGLTTSARKLDPWAGRWVYGDALQTLVSCYVDPISYRRLVVSGMESLRAALDNPTFRQRFIEADDPEKRTRFALAMDILILKARAADPWFAFQAADWLKVVLEKNRAMLALPDGAIVGEMLFGAIDTLDPYTRFMTSEMLHLEEEQLEGTYVGIGAELASRGGRVFLRQVFEGGAAAKAGLKPGDEITAVEGEPVEGLTLSALGKRLRGKEGSEVRVVVRSGGTGDPREVVLVRAAIAMPSVAGVEIIDTATGVGYVHLTVFKSDSEEELRGAVRRLAGEGMKALILDLRDNPGGYLESGVGVAGVFMARGRVVETRGRMIGSSWTYDVPLFDRADWKGPLAILVNENSASAAELMTAALQVAHRATVFGQRTFGKGAVQINVPVSGDCAVSVTIARFYEPAGQCLEGVGITPDHVVAEAEPVGDGVTDDAVVRAALAALAAPTEAR
jgi:carboxyl-terminal processing protease